MSITQGMHCSYPALLNNCAVHRFLRSLLLILVCIIMWPTEHKTQVICLVIAAFCIKLKNLVIGARKIEQVQHKEAGEWNKHRHGSHFMMRSRFYELCIYLIDIYISHKICMYLLDLMRYIYLMRYEI